MSPIPFYKYLLSLSLGLALLVFLSSFTTTFEEHQIFSWASLVFFISFTIGVYLLAERAAQSPNLSTFSSVILGVIFVKMLFIILIVLIYKKAVNPSSAWFLLPFFVIYLGFTIFEVYFMGKLGQVKPNKNNVQSSSK